MEQIPAAMDRHLEVVQCHEETGILLGASSLTGRYWFGSLWYYEVPDDAPQVEKCTAGVQLEAGLGDACWVGNNKVLVGMDTGSVALWELTDGHRTFIQQCSATEHDDAVTAVSVCKGEKNAVSSSNDRSIKIWDLETGYSVHTYTAHADGVLCVHCHSSQSSMFLSVSQDGTVCLWDTRNSKPVSRLDKSPLQSIPTAVSWQPGTDHMYSIGSDDGQLVVRDTRTAVTETLSYTPHHRPITRLQFSNKKSSLLASVSEDCSVIVTDISSDQPKQIYRDISHSDFVRGLSWSCDNKLYTCGWDSCVRPHTGILRPDTQAAGDSEQTKMEVNGETPNNLNVDSDSAKCVEKVKINGSDSDVKPDSPSTVTVTS